MPWGNDELGGDDLFWLPQPPVPPSPAQPPDLLADEGREGLHLQGGAHDDKQVHLQEVLRRGNSQEGSRTLRRGWATVPCSPPRAHLKPVWEMTQAVPSHELRAGWW